MDGQFVASHPWYTHGIAPPGTVYARPGYNLSRHSLPFSLRVWTSAGSGTAENDFVRALPR